MGKKLIIVESPAKIKTLQKFLGSDYIFESSLGHVRDLPEKAFGIDVENTFEPHYETLPDKQKVIKKLQDSAKKCDLVYLAPDPDREGEAIAWHIASILPKDKPKKRVTFNSITREAVLDSLKAPRDINPSLVNAQQARRLLDRIVGYKLSPILSRRIQKKRAGSLSAGRVQSVALKLVVDREKEIDAFKPCEYWSITASLTTTPPSRPFSAYLHSIEGSRIEKEPNPQKNIISIASEKEANNILKKLESAHYTVSKLEKKEKKRNPVPPFITSTLQQEASRHFGFSSAKTMRVAQDLYEGMDMGREGAEGLITYMRTDSVRISKEALEEARNYIRKHFGNDFLPKEPRAFSSKKMAQDAHEAIRPTNLEHPPEKVKEFLSQEQFKLYALIWKRFLASQMNPAIYDTVSVDVDTGKGMLMRASGSVIKFQGFLAIYEEKKDEEDLENQEKLLPELSVGQELVKLDINCEQSFTKPPARFTEASLVRELEKSGIGRPSTYATIMNKIQSREYTVKERKRLQPTELGKVIAQMLETSFPRIMNVSFTADMENQLEKIALNEIDWIELIKEFWHQFIPTVETAEKEARVPTISTDLDCPKCQSKLQKVWAKTKYFYGCSKFPDCDFTAPIEELSFNKDDYAADFDWKQKCPLCQSEMLVKHGRFGPFMGCSSYPECNGIVNIPKKGEAFIPDSELPTCPAIDCPGKIMRRKSRYGKTFYSCSTFPECNVIVNDINELKTKYAQHPRTAHVKKKQAKKTAKSKETKKQATKKKKKRAKSSSLYKLSPELNAVIEEEKLSRSDALKKLWDYIRKHNLQDPKDKRMVIPDEKLSALFGGSEPLSMFKFGAVISKHLKKDS